MPLAEGVNRSTAPVNVGEFESAEDAHAFRVLNEEWITRFFSLEPADREALSNPQGKILDKGGRIFLARRLHEAVGCVALIPMGSGVYELAKMAVLPALRGQGIGKLLLLHALAEAKGMGASCLFLGSSTKLPNAVRLYEFAGFEHVPRERLPPLPYSRADVFMELKL